MPTIKMPWRLVDRFKEPSTYSAIAAALAAIGFTVPAGVRQGLSSLGIGACVLLGVLLKEGTA